MGKYESVKKRPAIKEDKSKYQGVTTGRKKVKIGDKDIEIYNGFQNPEAYEDYQYNNNTYKVRKDVRPALERLIAGAKADGIDIPMSSSFRDYRTQVNTYNKAQSKDKVANPGGSRHGFGDAFDFTDPHYNTDKPTTQNYEVTPTYAWLARNAHKYGFVAPEEMYNNPKKAEPWHYEYYADYDPNLQQQAIAQQQALSVRPLPINPSVVQPRQIDYSKSLVSNLAYQPQQMPLPVFATNGDRTRNEF